MVRHSFKPTTYVILVNRLLRPSHSLSSTLFPLFPSSQLLNEAVFPHLLAVLPCDDNKNAGQLSNPIRWTVFVAKRRPLVVIYTETLDLLSSP
jgi:hypothetical protein